MKELNDHTDIIITKADKRGVVVIMDVKDYINEVHRQLNNKDHYKILNKDPKRPTTTNAKLVNIQSKDSEKRNYSKKNCRWLESVKPKNSKILYAAKNS